MRRVVAHDFESWRSAARRLLEQRVEPCDAAWVTQGASLFGPAVEQNGVEASACAAASAEVRVPPEFMELARLVACHRDEAKWDLLYRLAWRIVHGGEKHLLEIAVDDDVRRAELMAKAVRREAHKTKAFVRFRKVIVEGEDYYAAWHRPEHRVLRLVAEFFADRFASMRWSILTPEECLHHVQGELTYTPGAERSAAPAGDELEALWKTYYGAIFNPARVRLKAMKKEMPVRHWATLPEASIIDELLREAPGRVEQMVRHASGGEAPSAAAYLPSPGPRGRITLKQLQEAAEGCRGCNLYKHATQTVFGEGRATAKLMLIGEQPGDHEDLAGKPFIGPAGQLLDRALEEAGIERKEVYVTNAVKHFKYEPRGKRRIHSKPDAREISACRPWLEKEIEIVQPVLIVAMGATAAQALFGRQFRVTKQHGQVFESAWAKQSMATVHPSSILRAPDDEARKQAYADFVADLKIAAGRLT